MTATFYEIRDRAGELRAIHKRRDLPDGAKEVSWLQPDGKAGKVRVSDDWTLSRVHRAYPS